MNGAGGETICPSAGTKSDNRYYYDNFVYRDNIGSQLERRVLSAIFV
jgi:hypothetical protein